MSNILVLAISLPLFLVAVVIAVSTYRSSGAQFGASGKLVTRTLPYAVVVVAALYLARGGDNWALIALEIAFYIALTWVIVWAVRKQWTRT